MIRQLFSEHSGKISLQRIMSALCLIQAFFYLNWQIINGKPVDASTLTILLSVAVGGHVAHRFAEGKGELK